LRISRPRSSSSMHSMTGRDTGTVLDLGRDIAANQKLTLQLL
jgi:hypothetical protein